jgi:hypothetical protein
LKIVIGFDPGKNNFGISVVRFNRRHQPKIIKSFMLNEAIKSLLHGDFNQACLLFREAVRQLFKQFRPWRIIVERFLTRFRGFGNTGELIGVMIGIIWELARQYKIQILLTTAASWKNQFRRDTQLELKNIYKINKIIPIHCQDASLIALYGYSKVATYQQLNLTKFFRRECRRWLIAKQK